MSVRQEIIYDEKKQEEFKNAMRLAKDVLHYRIFELGMTAEEAMQTILTTKQPVAICSKPYKYEYNGMYFRTLEEIANKFNIKFSTLRTRMKLGFSLKEAIETPYQQRRGTVAYEYNGERFHSLTDIAEKFDINPATLKARLKRGIPLDVAIEMQKWVHISNKQEMFPYFDSSGKRYDSLEEVAKEYSIKLPTLKARLKKGIPLAVAIEMQKWSHIDQKYVYNNQEFYSIAEISKKFNIRKKTLIYRLAQGMSLKEAIETPLRSGRLCCVENIPPEMFEYEGVIYESKRSMCSAFGIDYNAFMKRLSRGWDIEKAIKTPIKPRKNCV